MGFGLHQALEYLTSALVILTALRLREGQAEPVLVAGLLLLAVAAVTDGPLGATRWLGRRAHAAADVVLVFVLVVGPLLFLDLEDDLPAAIVVWVAAGVLAVLATSTDYSRRHKRAARAPRPAPEPAPEPQPLKGSDTLNAAARVLGAKAGQVSREGPRKLGKAVGRYKAKRSR